MDILGSVLGFIGNERTNSANRRMANAQMRFQERMSNTAYQRGVKDLRKAGLNPILAATKGMGATTPGGATAQMTNSAQAAADMARQFAELDLIKQQTKKTHKEARNLDYYKEQIIEATEREIAQQRVFNNTADGIQYDNVGKALEAALYNNAPLIKALEKLGISPGSIVSQAVKGLGNARKRKK